MAGTAPDAQRERGFLAPPGEVADWRMVVLAGAALETGVLEALPGTAAEVAERAGLDAHAVRVVLDALCEFGIVHGGGDGTYAPGPDAPDADAAAGLRHHARAIGGWSAAVGERLRGIPPQDSGDGRTPERLETWLRALAAGARQAAPGLANRCLERFPHARRVLDVAGGHGEYGLELARRGLEVTLQDLPEVIEVVGAWPAVRDRGIDLFPADVFDRLPPGPFDLVLCAGFTHTQAPEPNAELFLRFAGIIAPGGGLAVHTFVRGQRPTAPLFAVQMLVGGRGGDTHGLDEYEAWAARAGFGTLEHVVVEPGRSLLLAELGGGP